MSFSSLGLSPYLLQALESQNYDKPYPIQEQAIPLILAKKDLLGIAKTGSGKTASYVLPILQALHAGIKNENRHAAVLVLVPTRELAVQVAAVFELFSKNLPTRVKTLAVYGGVSINPQMIALQGVAILVATPGRLIDLLQAKAVHLSTVSTLVLDEADKMLNLGFKEEMDQIFALLPSKKQNLLFSATLTPAVDEVNRLLLNKPAIVEIESEKDSIDQIVQTAYRVSEEHKGPLLRKIIQEHKEEQILIFTSSVRKADNVGHKLRKNGIRCEAIHSDKSQGAREAALNDFKTGRLKVLIATDLLARGIDIPMLPFVINYELPRSPKDYIHRIGRTGRADASGEAISFVTEDELHHFRVIQKKMGKWVTMIDYEAKVAGS